MVDFEIGKTYTAKSGQAFTVVADDGKLLTIQHLKLKRKARKVLYCGVNAAVFDFGKDMILAESIVPVKDETIEYGYVKQYKINGNGETYVSLFKRLKEKDEG